MWLYCLKCRIVITYYDDARQNYKYKCNQSLIVKTYDVVVLFKMFDSYNI